MIYISREEEQIKQIALSSISEYTEKIAHFFLMPSQFKKVEEQEAFLIVIEVGGIKQIKIICLVPNRMMQKVVSVMSRDKALSDEECFEYFKEYVNIITGRTTSKINNEILKDKGKIHFVIREISRFHNRRSRFTHDEAFTFHSEYGNLTVYLQFC